jgi:hypothetical protein
MSHEELDRFRVIPRARERRLTQEAAATTFGLGFCEPERLIADRR